MKTTRQEHRDRLNHFSAECTELGNKIMDVLPMKEGQPYSKMDVMKSVLANAAVLKSLLQSISEDLGHNGTEETPVTSVIAKLAALIEGFKIAVSYRICEDLHSESKDS